MQIMRKQRKKSQLNRKVNKYKDLLEEYTIKCPTLKEALKQMFISSGAHHKCIYNAYHQV